MRTRSWQWFADHVQGLLSLTEIIATPQGAVPVPGSLIAARFHTPEEAEDA